MEMPQAHSLCSYLKQGKMSLFFFYKIREQKGRIGAAWWWVVPALDGEDLGKGFAEGVTIGQILCYI
jgi:hypothetical protein